PEPFPCNIADRPKPGPLPLFLQCSRKVRKDVIMHYAAGEIDQLEACGGREAGWQRRFASLAGFLILAWISALCDAKAALPEVRDGDLIFQTSRSSQSLAIQRATGSPYSHMGLILYRNGKPYVFEAISTVRFTALDQWIARGDGHHFVVKRLRDAGKTLTPAASEKLRRAARVFEGRAYDLVFDWSDSQIYCSELVWKAYDRGLGIQIGRLQRVRDFTLSDPL